MSEEGIGTGGDDDALSFTLLAGRASSIIVGIL